MVPCMAAKKDIVKPAPAEIEFRELVALWVSKIKVAPARIRFQEMTKKWASCSTAGQITFNSVLLLKPRKFQEAVVVHELVHLLVPNHGKLFRSMFLSFMPHGEKVLRGAGIE